MPHSENPRLMDVCEAFLFLTRLPGPSLAVPRGARASWAWPLAGAGVGFLSGGVASVAFGGGLSAGAAAALALATQALLTGGLHEDGLADSADGFGGGRTPERRLEIMKDSRIGSHGALALILSLLIRWSALAALLVEGSAWGALVAAGALSRWPMAWMLHRLPPAREGGLSRLIGRPGAGPLALGAAVALMLALLGTGASALPATLAVALVALLWTPAVRRLVGGQTGDTCGAAQQLAEAAALLALAA
ncbi:adenosylcobinamide-GDP ribazoletransferase [Rubellimicrobium aerolatum]|uniref:Adenosylcobinamide-GDP ribazoletransferase n=1 Tax=Rubellimicrobium aerolatum TaxID=490979 RepID=A0ABW0SED0_9RHOB|nr:adenosylcobinamide-GDP ribazoletransferase [Rubellimicrobium aerolatum]MBP1805632.1 adenosylcobinamide-GDP ribazoletransferase [Rubellimicrobium aerolatum]